MQLTLVGGVLQIQLEWYEQLWAFHLTNPIQVSLGQIVTATTAEPSVSWAEIRAPGTFFPGLIKAGTYYTKQGKEFWYATQDHHYLCLALTNHDYRRIILTLPENERWANEITQQKSAATN